MITFNLICDTNHWPVRLKKIKILIQNVLKFKKDLYFKKKLNYDCNVVLTNDKLLKKMNNKYRNKNRATDVLTFVSEAKIGKNNRMKVCDIFFSAETIKNDAKKNGINFYNHFTHLIIHSFLHINGFVHDNFDDFNKMKKIEVKILKKQGIFDPYEKI